MVTIMAHWFGKGKKGLIFGIWNSHTSVGNIVGSILAGAFVEDSWGLSFIVPGAIIGALGIFMFFFLVPKPEIVGLEIPSPPEPAVADEGNPGEGSPLLLPENEDQVREKRNKRTQVLNCIKVRLSLV